MPINGTEGARCERPAGGNPATLAAEMPSPRPRNSKNEPRADLRRAVNKGDIAGLVDLLAGEYDLLTETPEKVRFLRRALEASSRRGVANLCDEALRLVLCLDLELLARAIVTAKRKIRHAERGNGTQFADLGSETFDNDLKRLAALQDRTVSIVKAVGTIQHLRTIRDQPAATRVQRPRSRGRIIALGAQTEAPRKAAGSG